MSLPGKLTALLRAALPDSLRPFVRKRYHEARAAALRFKRSRQKPLDLARLRTDLEAAGFGTGDEVMVHSALSRIGNVEGGAATVVESFLETVTPTGTILMPTYNRAGDVEEGMQSGALVDLRTSRSLTGKITETFRTWKGVRRSSHPFSSVCAWGAQAEYVTSDHASDPHICHATSPVGRQVERNMKIVGLGIPIAPGLGVAHYLEDTWDQFPFRVHQPPFTVRYFDAAGEEVERPVLRFDPAVAETRIDHPRGIWICAQLTAHFERKGILTRFKYGEANCWLMRAQPLYEELKRLAGKCVTMYLTEEGRDDRNRDVESW